MQDSLTQTEREERINVKHVKTMSPHIRCIFFPLNPTAVPWLRQLGAGLPLGRAGSSCRPVHVMFVLDRVSMEEVFLPSTSFPLSVSFHYCCLLTHPFTHIPTYSLILTLSLTHSYSLTHSPTTIDIYNLSNCQCTCGHAVSLSPLLSATWGNVLCKTVLVSSTEMGMVLKLYCTSVHKCSDCTVICN